MEQAWVGAAVASVLLTLPAIFALPASLGDIATGLAAPPVARRPTTAPATQGGVVQPPDP
jgi:hypothetical protein